jgi:hypothetical protein
MSSQSAMRLCLIAIKVGHSTAKAQNLPRLRLFHRKKQHMQQTESAMAAVALDDETRP